MRYFSYVNLQNVYIVAYGKLNGGLTPTFLTAELDKCSDRCNEKVTSMHSSTVVKNKALYVCSFPIIISLNFARFVIHFV